jgi:hypothetical protein
MIKRTSTLGALPWSVWERNVKRYGAVVLLCLFSMPFVSAQQAAPKPVSIYVEGDSSVIPKFINMCREMGPERGLEFRFMDKQGDPFDYRVVLSSEGSSAWNFAQGNIVVLNHESKVIFTVTRSNRWTAKGATSALTKEFIKVLSRYLGTHD